MSKKADELMLNKLLEVSVADVYFYDKTSGLEMYTATLTNHNIEQSGDQEPIKCGRGNETIATISKSKDLSFTITDVVSNISLEAAKYGGTIKEVGSSGTVDAFHMPKNYTVAGSSSKEVTLTATPKAGEEVLVYNLKTKKPLTKSSDYSIEGNKITITASDIEKGDEVFVTGFSYAAKTTDKYFDIATDSTMPSMFAVVEVPLFDTNMNLYATKQYIFPKVQMDVSVSQSGASEKSAPSIETKVTVMKDDSVDYLGRVVLLMPEAV